MDKREAWELGVCTAVGAQRGYQFHLIWLPRNEGTGRKICTLCLGIGVVLDEPETVVEAVQQC